MATVTDLIPDATSTLRKRVGSKIVKSKRDQCWQWRGSTSVKRGGARRPKIQVGARGSRTVLVARVLLVLADKVPLHERIGQEAGHKCGRFWCVNWRHLEWVDRATNEDQKNEYDESIDDAGYPATWDTVENADGDTCG